MCNQYVKMSNVRIIFSKLHVKKRNIIFQTYDIVVKLCNIFLNYDNIYVKLHNIYIKFFIQVYICVTSMLK